VQTKTTVAETRLAAIAMAAIALLARSASAQQDSVSVPVAARESRETNALEIGLGFGSAQGYGHAESGGPRLDDMGIGADVSVGWRINPRWMVGVYSSSALYPAMEGGASTVGTAAGVQANYHFSSKLRPWVGLGAGWHGYWISYQGERKAYQGADLARLQLGVDVPITPSFSVEPLLGLTLATFAPQKNLAGSASDARSSSLSVFVLIGALARFDLFGNANRAD
jgi:hypothetical protein